MTQQDNQYECDLFLTNLIKFLVITHLFLAFFGKNVLLTAKIKNTIIVALESAESLYHKFGLQLVNKSVQICN